ncbi:MAG TPA: endo alpha-1,4 polygalactosaminidase [Solirubrobacterales bacterium]|nr:endo alpha-1,4 polygalactosaminidase [Solirubrobacterales bacterium]
MLSARIPRALPCALAFLLLALMVVFAACSSDPERSEAKSGRWQPKPTIAAWQFQLQGRIDLSIDAPVYEVDGFDVSGATVGRLHARGRKVICYIDVGSWENYRPDAKRFPKSVIGKKYERYPNERWLDIRRFHKFAGPIKARIRMCARKGFDGLEPDNINGWENRTGFPLTARHQLRFNRWIARLAHRNGLAVGLKNDGRQARKLVGDFDFAVVEQCFQYTECGQYRPFVRHGKAVFAVEYERPTSAFCGRAKKIRFSAIGKEYDLFARPWRPCS